MNIQKIKLNQSIFMINILKRAIGKEIMHVRKNDDLVRWKPWSCDRAPILCDENHSRAIEHLSCAMERLPCAMQRIANVIRP